MTPPPVPPKADEVKALCERLRDAYAPWFLKQELAQPAAHMMVIADALAAQQERIRTLEGALTDAIECVESWSGYASSYFQDKHDLEGDLKRLNAALAGSALRDAGKGEGKEE